MFIPDIRSETALLLSSVAAITAVSPVQAAENYVVGICRTATQSVGAEIRPTYAADDYLANYHADDPRYKTKLASGEFFSGAKITIVKAPTHGEVALADVPNVSNGQYHYMPKEDYFGRDNFVMQVEKDGVKVRIEYLIEGIDDDAAEEGVCDQESWKISAIAPTFDNASLQTLAHAIGINNTFTVNASALTGGAVGQTTGTPSPSTPTPQAMAGISTIRHI